MQTQTIDLETRQDVFTALKPLVGATRAKECEKYIFEFFEFSKSSMVVTDPKLSYCDTAYEIIGLFMTTKDVNSIIEDLKNKKMCWDMNSYNVYRDIADRDMEKDLFRSKTIKGIYTCKDRECGSDEFFVWQSQTRSGDEGMTTFRQCAKCSKRTKE